MGKRIVAIGGGHGLAIIVRALKQIEDIDITAIVTVADDGGSTGRLRKYYNIPAMGDIRNVLLAMAESESLLQGLMDYRFEGDQEEDIVGHNLGNLILTALTNSTGSFSESIAILAKVLNVKGKIIPSSQEIITLHAIMEDGTIVRGEANIPDVRNRIQSVYYTEEVHAMPEAVDAILNADVILYGIGSVYTSILPNIIIPDINLALKESKATKVYLCNAMSQPGETDGYGVEEHASALIDHGADIDIVLRSNDTIPLDILRRYHEEGSHIVYKKMAEHPYKIMEASLLSFDDKVIRHDPNKLRLSLEKLFKEV
ncbi:MAG: uridine diphosphate-N-acetylglucosamine-binding protein YvcK [Erysipelotrichaceae bacterium]